MRQTHPTIWRSSKTAQRVLGLTLLAIVFVLFFAKKVAGVHAAQDCGDALQVASSPSQAFFAMADPRSSFDGTHLLFAARSQQPSNWQIYESDADGSNARPITHCAGDCTQAEYLPGGRIVYTERGAGSMLGSSTVMVARLDGSDAHAITFGPGDFQVVSVLHNGRILLAANAPLAKADIRHPQRALYQMRPDGSGLYRLPQAVAQQMQREQSPAPVQLPGIFPQRYAQRPVPLLYPSILHLESKTGRMLCLNAYQTLDAPGGKFTAVIAQVRVLTLGKDGHERVLGNAPVETDGSFYLTVPADTPVRFALLAKNGALIHEQKSWIWARPGEDRGCAGCHENPALAPENHWPLALKRFDTPTPLGTEAGMVNVHKDGRP